MELKAGRRDCWHGLIMRSLIARNKHSIPVKVHRQTAPLLQWSFNPIRTTSSRNGQKRLSTEAKEWKTLSQVYRWLHSVSTLLPSNRGFFNDSPQSLAPGFEAPAAYSETLTFKALGPVQFKLYKTSESMLQLVIDAKGKTSDLNSTAELVQQSLSAMNYAWAFVFPSMMKRVRMHENGHKKFSLELVYSNAGWPVKMMLVLKSLCDPNKIPCPSKEASKEGSTLI